MDDDSIPESIVHDIDGDGYFNEDDYFPYDETKWEESVLLVFMHRVI